MATPDMLAPEADWSNVEEDLHSPGYRKQTRQPRLPTKIVSIATRKSSACAVQDGVERKC